MVDLGLAKLKSMIEKVEREDHGKLMIEADDSVPRGSKLREIYKGASKIIKDYKDSLLNKHYLLLILYTAHRNSDCAYVFLDAYNVSHNEKHWNHVIEYAE